MCVCVCVCVTVCERVVSAQEGTSQHPFSLSYLSSTMTACCVGGSCSVEKDTMDRSAECFVADRDAEDNCLRPLPPTPKPTPLVLFGIVTGRLGLSVPFRVVILTTLWGDWGVGGVLWG